MIPSSLSVKEILESQAIEASAPCRIDSGGTWDIKAIALPLEGIAPVTVNMALTLRTWVSLFPFRDGWVKVSSEGFPKEEQYPYGNIRLTSPFGLFFAAICHFGFHGLSVRIRSDSPVKSSLGGSSTALIALIKALSKLRIMVGGVKFSRKEILLLGYHLEDGVSGGNCGMQDQAAAVYGGLNRWTWHYGRISSPFTREPLLDAQGLKEISRCIVVAYSGESHVSSRTNQTWVHDFLAGRTRAGWIRVNDIVKGLAEAIKEKDWRRAAGLLRDEMALRREITPNALIPITEKLLGQAESLKCGARFAGAGAGGSIWALGEVEGIRDLRKAWERTLKHIKGARILDCAIDSLGVR